MLIELNTEEIYQAKRIALGITRTNNKTDYQASFGGIMAEIAAIKFFNYGLGCHPRIELNEVYINGGDGGFDFCFPDNLCKWDVKSTNKDYFESEHLKTKANVIIAVERLGKAKFNIIGFCPVSKLPTIGKVSFSYFAEFNIREWLRIFKNRLNQECKQNEIKDFQPASKIIASVMVDLDIACLNNNVLASKTT